MITFENEFHHTTANALADVGDVLRPSQIRRLDRKLCGMKDCSCGSYIGEHVNIVDHKTGLVRLIELNDGRFRIQRA